MSGTGPVGISRDAGHHHGTSHGSDTPYRSPPGPLDFGVGSYSLASASEIQASTFFTSVFTTDSHAKLASHLPAPLLILHSRPDLATQLMNFLIDASGMRVEVPDALLLLCLRGRIGNETTSRLTYMSVIWA